MRTDYQALLAKSQLERDDFKLRTWPRLRALLEDRLADLREQNDNRLDDEKTANLRGRIAEVKALLALEQLASAPASSGPGSASSLDAFPEP